MDMNLLSRASVVSSAWRYCLAAASCGLALAVALPTGEASSCFLPAVMVSSLIGGKGPGILSIGLSVLCFDYFFLPPLFHFSIARAGYIHFAVFLGAAIVVAVLTGAKRRAEDAERGRERNFREIVESIHGLIAVMGLAGEVELVNRQVVEYFGRSLDELRGWAMSDAVHPDDLPGVIAAWTHSVKTGEPYDVEHRIRRHDGVYRWFQARALRVRDANGGIVRWCNLLTDIDDRRKAEDALRESELNFRLTVDSIPGLVHTMSAAGVPEFVNQQILDFFGKSEEELRNWASLLHPEDRDQVVGLWGDCAATGHPFVTEVRALRADGVYRWIHARGLPLRDTNGRIVRWYNLLTDIDDHKRAEEALRASELNFRLLVNSVPGFLNTHTPTGEVELANRTLLNYTGRTLDELKDWSAIVHPGDLPAVTSLWSISVHTGRPLDAEFRVRRADGVYRWFHARALPLRDKDERIVRWYTLLTDVEDRRIAEDDLRTSERELSLIIEMIPGLVWSASRDGELTYVNQRTLAYMGVTLDAVTQAGWTRFLHPDDFEPTVLAWSRAVATGQRHEIQYRLRGSEGAYRWFHALGQPLRDRQGDVVRWYGLLIDIDDRKSMEETLRSTQARLSRAIQIATVGELAASIAHEINQPLAAVVANGHACVRWLTAESPSIAKAREAAERVVRDGREAGEVVRRIRALFRRASPEMATIDLNGVIGEVLDLLRGEMSRRHVAVNTELEAALPSVTGDRVQLQQLVLNLVVNGMDAMETICESARKISLRSTWHCEGNALVEVQDWGVGLKDPDKVFEAFFTTKEHGMGMGLTICRSIVEAHGGQLWASSADGPGAVFRFTLPLAPGTPA